MKLDYGKGSNKLDEVVAIFTPSSFFRFFNVEKKYLIKFFGNILPKKCKKCKNL